MKAIIIFIAVSILLAVILIFSEPQTVGEYHNLSYNTIGGMTVINMKDDTDAINIPSYISEHIYEFISEIKPSETREANNNEDLTDISYMMVIIEVNRSYYITIGDDYLSIVVNSDKNETEETIHIVDERIIDDLEELIETQIKRAN